ncbi:hypothetical protein KM043_018551 [Ampulex compressa]|nr:hypothetical protein KM043_018551 [Ampulex compressa]
MASRDKGRRKWGGFSQESASSKLETEMRAGSNRAAQALYRPGSGPLRKSGRTVDDLDHENIPQDKQKASVQHRLRQATRSDMPFQVDSLADKLNDMNVEFGDRSQEPQEVVDARRRNKKPEQQLYVPKKVKEALAEQDTTKKSLVQVVWERDCERENSDCNPQSNRSHRYYRSGGNGDRVRDDFSKRYSGNRRSRQGNENEERWRSDSPLSARSYGCRKDSLREVRQGSEPLFLNHTNEPSRTRDTRSVEPDKFQGKPPSGRRGSTKESLSKNIKLEHLPPRLQMKYLIDNGLPLPSTNAVEESWNGSSITFQGSYNYPHTMQHSTAMQNLSPSGGLNPQTNWSNTVPARSRGRGRLRVEELEGSGGIHRSVTPDQYSATSSRSHTPSQEYAHRSYDRRGSNSTMYTSMESLSRADSLMMPPPRSISPSATARSTNRCLISPESSRRNTSSPSTTQRSSHAQRVNNNAYERSVPQEKQASTDSSLKSEQCGTLANVSNERPFDWCEEVELNEKLEAERLSRSSSVLSLRESASMPFNQHAREGGRRCKKKRRDKKHITDRSRDKARMSSRERQNNQQNRENDACSQRNNSTGRHFDHRRKRNIIQRSPEQSKDRNYRNNSRNFDDLHRHRDRLLEENWRTGRKMSTCDSEDGGQAAGTLFPNTISNLPGTHQTQASSFTSTPSPGLLVLSDANQSPLVARQQSAQQQRTLFDPKNPNKPIVVTSPSSRVALQKENEDAQGTSVPVLQPGNGNTSHQFHGVQLDSVLPPFMNHDQIGSMRPSWYDPYSDSFRSAKDPYLLLDIERADLELQWILSSGGLATRLDRVMCVREYLQEALRTLLERDMKFCQVENVEQHFWKILFYNIIEMLRKEQGLQNNKKTLKY